MHLLDVGFRDLGAGRVSGVDTIQCLKIGKLNARKYIARSQTWWLAFARGIETPVLA